MNFHASFDRPARRSLLPLALTLILILSLVTGNVLAASPSSPDGMRSWDKPWQPKGSGNALFAVFLDGTAQLTQLQSSDLVLYSHISSSYGDILLVGATPEVAGRLGATLQLLDTDTTGSSYFLAHSPVHATPVIGGRFTLFHLGRLLGDGGPPVIATQPADAEAIVGFPASLSVTLAHGQPPLSQLWYQDGTALTGATNATLALSNVRFSHAGIYRVMVSNALGVAISQPASLRVVSGPRLVSVGSLEGSTLGICFNVPVTAASAQNRSNYFVSSGGPITQATLQPDGRTVLFAALWEGVSDIYRW